MQVGGQKQVGDDWFLGGSMAYVHEDVKADSRLSRMNGDGFLAGVHAKRQWGGFSAALGLTAGTSRYDSVREIRVAGAVSQATGRPDIAHYGAHARLAWQAGGVWNTRTVLNLSATHVRSDAFTEAGSAYALDLARSSRTIVTAAPVFELGRAFIKGDRSLRPFVRLGISLRSANSWQSEARFVASPDVVDPFVSSTALPRQTGHVGGGFDLGIGDHLSVQLQYDGELGRDYGAHSGSFRLVRRF